MKLDAHQVLRSPRITEKAMFQQATQNAYTFEVHPKANKHQVKQAVQTLFGVTVKAVHTQNRSGKARRTRMGQGTTPAWKKAIVTLAEGEQIEGL